LAPYRITGLQLYRDNPALVRRPRVSHLSSSGLAREKILNLV
jgi:hypothetical protein